MNRRGFFSFLAAAPVAVMTAKTATPSAGISPASINDSARAMMQIMQFQTAAGGGTYMKPPRALQVRMCGAGGTGGAGEWCSVEGSGGAGAYNEAE